MYIFVEANYFILRKPWFISAFCFSRCLESIWSSITHDIIWETNLKKYQHLSDPFHVTNGVRQGGVLSPYLFAIYLDELSTETNQIKKGCSVGEVILNYVMFADDICVFCPSAQGLQSILDVFQAYAESHGIIFNCNKTACMMFNTLDTSCIPCGDIHCYRVVYL